MDQSDRRIIDSVEHELVRLVPHALDSSPFALCRAASGELKCLEAAVWNSLPLAPATPSHVELATEAAPHPSTSPVEPMATQQVTSSSNPPSTSIVTKHSSANEKVTLFRSLFRGCDDVFAHGYVSKKTGKVGYSLVCKNLWKRGVCPKCESRGARCDNCKNKA